MRGTAVDDAVIMPRAMGLYCVTKARVAWWQRIEYINHAATHENDSLHMPKLLPDCIYPATQSRCTVLLLSLLFNSPRRPLRDKS